MRARAKWLRSPSSSGVTKRTIYTWLARRKENQTLAPKPHAGRRAVRVDEKGAKLLAQLVGEKDDRTLAEYADAYFERCGVRLNRVTLQRAMVRLKLPRKKRTPRVRAGPRRREGGARKLKGKRR